MLTLPGMWDHQNDLITRGKRSVAKVRRSILCAGTGVGKTRCSKWILTSYHNNPIRDDMSGHALFAVHRRGLVQNASDSLNESPSLPHGVIMSGKKPKWDERIQVASIDTLLSWFCEGSEYKTTQTYDLIFYDECHAAHSRFATFLARHDEKRLELGLNKAIVFGLSATPQAEGLSDVYNDIVFGPEKQWLIDNGYLKPYRYYRATEGKLNLLKGGAEFTEASLDAAFSGLAGDLIRDWKNYSKGYPTIGFFPRRSHALEAKGVLLAAGVRCEYIDGATDDTEREAIYKMMRRGDIDYIANVGVVERGTDIPRCGCVQLCTSVKSLTRHFQMIGRGSRPHPDIPECIVIDHGGNLVRNGFFEDEIKWCLDWDSRPDKEHTPRSSMPCPSCGAIYRGGLCPNCGHEPTKAELLKEGLNFNGVELVEVERNDRKEPKKSDPEAHWISILYRAGKAGMTLAQAVGMAYGEAKRKNIVGFSIPATFAVAGGIYQTIPKGDKIKSNQRVDSLYPFTIGNYKQCDNQHYIGPVEPVNG